MSYVTWINILVYLGIGFLFTIVKVYFKGRESTLSYERELSYLKENVFRWWFIWPISLTHWIFTDLLGDFWNWTYSRFQSTFEYFLKLGFSDKKVTIKRTPSAT